VNRSAADGRRPLSRPSVAGNIASMQRLGILLSGSGSTYENLANACAARRMLAEIAVVVSSSPTAGGIARARRLGHPVVVAKEPDAVTAALLEARCDWVAMCGWLRYYDPPTAMAGRVVNVHPSLLPAFGGQGMYGHHVHDAVLAHGCRISGCTVHLVEGGYDTGAILAQRAVPVLDDDDASRLAARVQAAERAVYPEVLAALMQGALAGNGRRRRLAGCLTGGWIGETAG
jgi:phosphoribosylglycinamide formyltransferase-1